jgi:hypothetical protein
MPIELIKSDNARASVSASFGADLEVNLYRSPHRAQYPGCPVSRVMSVDHALSWAATSKWRRAKRFSLKQSP